MKLITAPAARLTTEGTKRHLKSQCFYGQAHGAKQQIETHMDVDLQPVAYFLPSYFFPRACVKQSIARAH